MTQLNQTHERVRIRVTSMDCDVGHRGDPESCPIALAASRTFGRPCLVGAESISLGAKGTGRSFEFSQAVADRMAAFDEGESMRPFSFVAWRATTAHNEV